MSTPRSLSFGDDAEAYDQARPSYPDTLIDDLVADAPIVAADVGCGTGIASRLLVARGVRVIGIEPDARMAAIAQRHGVETVHTPFEQWQPDAPVDLLIAAQSWHWVDQEKGPRKAAQVLRPRGRFGAIWNNYSHVPGVHAQLLAAYEAHAPQLIPSCLTLGSIQADDDWFVANLDASGRFSPAERRSYTWERKYTAESYVFELDTHSDHHQLDRDTAEPLYDAIGTIIESAGGITVTMRTALITATTLD